MHREHIRCERAIKVARHYFSTFRDTRKWDCEGTGNATWFGYCQTRRAYFDWKPINY